MLRTLILTAVFSFGFANLSWAVDPQPKSEVNEKVQNVRSSHSGAIKVENKTAVPPEALKKDAEAPQAVPAAPAAAASPSEKQVSAETGSSASDSGGSHLFGLHASVGVPHPINFGLNYVHPSRIFSAEVSTGSYSMTIDSVDVSLLNTEIGLRWHPWAGSFYLGALLGTQSIKAKKTDLVSGVSVTGEAEVKSTYATPHLGWMWGLDDGGFFVSFDVGVQSPSGVSTTFTSNVPNALQAHADYVKLEKDVKDEGDKIGKMTLPYMSLLKLGYMF